ncbi:isopentenyl-diphosphate Delta-isomerase (plasmid) [Mesorhizobium loti]|nr:isopentenyl-diphosphate Delta-isomerase [Mesorhizobium loti]
MRVGPTGGFKQPIVSAMDTIGSYECQEHVVLLGEEYQVIGTAPKLEAHERGLLHRAFSTFVVNTLGEIRMQGRAVVNYHSPGCWSNTCCGHPRRGEAALAAPHRRLEEEMGFDCGLRPAGVFQYRARVEPGLIEHEIDHLFVAVCNEMPVPNPAEVSDWTYVPPPTLSRCLSEKPSEFTAWLPYAFAHVRNHLSVVTQL